MATNPAGQTYAMVTPVHNEEHYIRAMIESVADQTVRPAKWVVIDDGSSDSTASIVAEYAAHLAFIELVQLPARKERLAGGEGAIAHGLKQIRLEDFAFLARFDADLVLDRDYMSHILEEFRRDPELGIAGGGLYVRHGDQHELEKAPEYHVRGAVKMYRRECFQDIGGLHSCIGWDTIDEVYAWSKGWKTKSFFQYKVIHCRPTGAGMRARKIFWERGKAEYFTWSYPLFVFLKTAKLMGQKLSLVEPVWFLAGFLCCYPRMLPRLQDPIFASTRRRQQLQRITSAFRLGRIVQPHHFHWLNSRSK